LWQVRRQTKINKNRPFGFFSTFVKWITTAAFRLVHVDHHRMAQANWNPGLARPSVAYCTDGLVPLASPTTSAAQRRQVANGGPMHRSKERLFDHLVSDGNQLGEICSSRVLAVLRLSTSLRRCKYMIETGTRSAPKRNRKDPVCFGPYPYRARNLVEGFFNEIRRYRRVTTRYDKLAANYPAFVNLASIRTWLRANECAP